MTRRPAQRERTPSGAPRARRRGPATLLTVVLAATLLPLGACTRSEESTGGPSPSAVRAERRAYDGAPPVIPHERLGAACTSCHNEHGVAVEGLGFAPPSPHEWTEGLSATSRCEQCHVFQVTAEVFATNEFSGLRQDLRRGGRLDPGAPPVMPHPAFMRENCRACHTGPAARAEIVCDHPERLRCPQCHVEAMTTAVFGR